MRAWQTVLVGAMVISLAGCGGGNDDGEVGDNPALSVIQWSHDPLAVVFRANVVGGDLSVTDVNNSIPDCTLYGDGRVVYPQNNPNGRQEVIFDTIDDNAIEGFINDLTIGQRIFTYSEGYSRQQPQSIVPVYEQLVLEVNGERHVTDVFASWPPSYYQDVLKMCRELALRPRLFSPTGAWISAVEVPLDLMKPQIIWDSTLVPFSFVGLVVDGSKRWIEGGVVGYLWDQVIAPSIRVRFVENDQVFEISLQVPGVMLDAPAAPAQ